MTVKDRGERWTLRFAMRFSFKNPHIAGHRDVLCRCRVSPFVPVPFLDPSGAFSLLLAAASDVGGMGVKRVRV
jgi:hypothetical protein